jgi:putative transposase
MPRIARCAPPGCIYHALNRAVARLLLFQRDADYEAFERVVAEAQEKFPIEVLAYCLMPGFAYALVLPVLLRRQIWAAPPSTNSSVPVI